MKDRHGHSNRLEILLKDFQHANCNEPRDKIYGFLGLALDTLDGSIQVDYGISLWELYRVVIEFFCKPRFGQDASWDYDYRGEHLIEFSLLLQHLFPKIEIPGQVSLNNNDIFTIISFPRSRILELGPSYYDMISSSAANKLWKRSFEEHYSLPYDIQVMRETNEVFLYGMIDEDVSRLEEYAGQINPFKFYSNGFIDEFNNPIEIFANQAINWDFELPGYDIERGSQDPLKEESSQPSLRMFYGENRFLGLAPGSARVGDIICTFSGTPIAALLRMDKRYSLNIKTSHYRVVGTVQPSARSLNGLTEIYSDPTRQGGKAKRMIIQMDIRTLAALTPNSMQLLA